jgi:formiminotetrahydrofolate cyclodeaminase
VEESVPLTVFLLLVLEIELGSRSHENTRETPGHHMLSVASCVALRIVEMVADFSLNRKWRGDLIHRWEEAFQLLQAMDNKLQVQVSERLDS